jgi:hypothetical protein
MEPSDPAFPVWMFLAFLGEILGTKEVLDP